MQIKIQCQCGTRFSFEVEPVNGRMPVRINCPTCGADATELANAVIQARLAPAEATQPDPPAMVPPAQDPPLRIRKSAPPQAPAAPPPSPLENAGGTERCAKHPREPVVEHCRVCGKPLCAKCMELFGYVCSVYCRDQAERQKIRLPAYRHQRAVLQQKARTRTRLAIAAGSLLFVALIGAWIWYAWVGSHPKVIYAKRIAQNDGAEIDDLIAPHDVLSVADGQMTLYDPARQKQLWSARVNSDSPAGSETSAAAAGTVLDLAGAAPRVVVTTNDIWLLFADHIEQYDRRTGAQKRSIPLKPPAISLEANAHALVAVSETGPGRETATEISLPAGAVRTEQIGSEPGGEKTGAATGARTTSAPRTGRAAADLGIAGSPDSGETTEFFADGDGLLQVNIRLLEHKIVTREAMKPEGKSHLNSQLTANDSLAASQEVLNDIRRQQTGGVVQEDVSRYQVNLQPWPAKGKQQWSGEVIGPPAFYSLKTVNVLAGGSSISVFNKNDKKLWDAKTTYSLPQPESTPERNPPCVEAGDTLYVFDQGMLTAFDLLSGNVRWRLTSVGISRVQTGPHGNLYVDSTTASPDSIQFSQQINIFKKAQPALLKVDPRTGKVLWRVERIVKDCFLSGKFVYAAMRSSDPMAALNPSAPAGHYYNLYRLNPSNGRVLWHYYQSRWPVHFAAQGNWILLRFPDELQVLKFLSF